MLDRLLAKLKTNGHRVVLFSQFKTMLDILEDYLIMRGYKYRYARVDGDHSLRYVSCVGIWMWTGRVGMCDV